MRVPVNHIVSVRERPTDVGRRVDVRPARLVVVAPGLRNVRVAVPLESSAIDYRSRVARAVDRDGRHRIPDVARARVASREPPVRIDGRVRAGDAGRLYAKRPIISGAAAGAVSKLVETSMVVGGVAVLNLMIPLPLSGVDVEDDPISEADVVVDDSLPIIIVSDVACHAVTVPEQVIFEAHPSRTIPANEDATRRIRNPVPRDESLTSTVVVVVGDTIGAGDVVDVVLGKHHVSRQIILTRVAADGPRTARGCEFVPPDLLVRRSSAD